MMRILACFVLFGIAALSTVAAASAQDRLFVGDSEIGAFGRFGERIGPAPSPVYGQLVGGGRYVFSSGAVYDASGAFVYTEGGLVVAVDPRRPRLFMHDLAMVSMFDLDTRELVPLVPAKGIASIFATLVQARLAADTNELFIWRQAQGGGEEVIVVDLATRAITRGFAVDWQQTLNAWRVTDDGRRIVTVSTISSAFVVRLVDSATGSVLAAAPSGGIFTAEIIEDRHHGRIYVRHARSLHAFDDELRPLGSIALRSTCSDSAVRYSPHTDRLYIVDSLGGDASAGSWPATFFLTTLSAADGRVIGQRDITAAGFPTGWASCRAPLLALLTAPGPPRSLVGGVAGHDVTLSWTNVGDASNFILDAGIAPGRTDLTFSIGATSPVTIPNAPPGTYYLRVRGTNAFGVSRPSNEVVVTVP